MGLVSRMHDRFEERVSGLVAVGMAAVSLSFAGAAFGQAAPVRVEDTMAQRMQACVVCHGKEGRATSAGYFPRIAGKPAGYLYNQLVNFREGRRHNGTMAYLVENMSDDYLREISVHFSRLDLPYPPAQPAAVPAAGLERGAALVRQGDSQRGLPACVACHGERMTGVKPTMPGLIGLPRDYLLAQLGGWRNGQRSAGAPDCMGAVARKMSPEDVVAVASWLAAQNTPADAKPAESVPSPLPLECGSWGR